MPALKSILTAAALASLAQAETIRVKATEDDKFEPNDIDAKKGDVVEFVFEPKNHSVVAGNYDVPCSPLQIGEGFWSGFIDSDKGEADKVFRVTINNTDPIVFYSSQGNECPDGMVGIINGNSTRNLTDYTERASQVSSGVDGDVIGSSASGGRIVDNDGGDDDDDDKDDDKNGDDNDSSDSSNDNNDDDDDGAAGMIRVPTVGLLAAVGLAFFMA